MHVQKQLVIPDIYVGISPFVLSAAARLAENLTWRRSSSSLTSAQSAGRRCSCSSFSSARTPRAIAALLCASAPILERKRESATYGLTYRCIPILVYASCASSRGDSIKIRSESICTIQSHTQITSMHDAHHRGDVTLASYCRLPWRRRSTPAMRCAAATLYLYIYIIYIIVSIYVYIRYTVHPSVSLSRALYALGRCLSCLALLSAYAV